MCTSSDTFHLEADTWLDILEQGDTVLAISSTTDSSLTSYLLSESAAQVRDALKISGCHPFDQSDW